jgi:hypothetical protein
MPGALSARPSGRTRGQWQRYSAFERSTATEAICSSAVVPSMNLAKTVKSAGYRGAGWTDCWHFNLFRKRSVWVSIIRWMGYVPPPLLEGALSSNWPSLRRAR